MPVLVADSLAMKNGFDSPLCRCVLSAYGMVPCRIPLFGTANLAVDKSILNAESLDALRFIPFDQLLKRRVSTRSGARVKTVLKLDYKALLRISIPRIRLPLWSLKPSRRWKRYRAVRANCHQMAFRLYFT